MRGHLGRALPVAMLVGTLMIVLAGVASAHTGEGVSMEHVLIEIGTWVAIVAGVIAAIMSIFWVRARVSRR